jgi:hypothetical protein
VDKKLVKVFERYSPPLSVWNCLILRVKRFSIKHLNLTNMPNTLDLFWIGNNYVYLEKSSMKRTQNLLPFIEERGDIHTLL